MKKLLIILFSCCTLVLLAGYVSYRGYKAWKQQHLMTMARDFLSKSDERNAVLCLRLVLNANPHNLDATLMMANLMTAARSPSALLWRSRVVELTPNSWEARLSLAQTALTFQDYPSATKALDGLDAVGRTNVNYHMVAGAVAVAMNQLVAAEAHFTEAAKLDPTNQTPKLNLAVIRLHGTNSLDLEEARIVVRRILAAPANPNLRCQALRELILDAVRFQQTQAALSFSQQLTQDTNSVFADRILHLNVLQAAHSPELNATRIQFRQDAVRDPAKIYELANWEINTFSSAQDTLAWLTSLNPGLKTNLTVMLLTADCYALVRDWRGLQSAVERQDWHELDFLRHAFKTRALKNQDLAGAAKAEWETTVKAANYDKASLLMLLQASARWNWGNEAEEILWAIVNNYPDQKWAVGMLTQALYSNGRTRPLMLLFSQQIKRAPTDLEAKNNLAVAALLLGASELKPHELALQVYQQAPTNASFASTYAFSLHVQKKDTEALNVLERLSPQDRSKPAISGYYGLVLQATGNRSKAKACFEAALKAQLLPEERRLFELAIAGS